MRSTEIAQLLPGVFQRTLAAGGGPAAAPLPALLAVMEALHARAEEVLGELDRFCDPNRTPDAFAVFLARWVDLERIFPARGGEERFDPISSGTGNLRQLVAASAFLSRWRGTRDGLARFLEPATGVSGFAIEENAPGDDGRPRPFHIRVRAPHAAEPHRSLIERIIDVERPAYCTCSLLFAEPAA